jgi:hypothetical protein
LNEEKIKIEKRESADRIRRLNPDFEMAAFESLHSELHD